MDGEECLLEIEDHQQPGTPDQMEIIEEVSIDTTEVHSGSIAHETEIETDVNPDDEDESELSIQQQPQSTDLTSTSEDHSHQKRGNEIRYSNKERVRLILLHAEHPSDPRRVKNLFEAEFHKKPPATRTITQLYKKFLQTGSVQNNYQKIRPRKSRTDENVERVKQAFQKSPTKSIRKISQELKIPHSTVSRILQELKGKEAGQIKRSRALKIGYKKEATRMIVQHESAGSVQEPENTVTTTGLVQAVIPSDQIQQQQQQQQLQQQPNQNVVTLQAQPIVATIRTQPSIFILETAPSRDMLGSLFSCLEFACKKHSSQRRKDPEQTPYINHPIGVANILINEGGITDLEVIQAAILHDTLEDTETTVDELRTQFGDKVTSIVVELTDDKTQSKEVRKLMQIENAPKKSHGAQLVGMADKIYNLRDLTRVLPVGWTEERRLKYVLWAQEVVRHYYRANESLAKILKDIFLHWIVLNYSN